MTRFQELIQGWIEGRLEPASFEAGVARMEMEAGPRHHNPMGIVHGGILCDLADAAMGVAFAATLEEGESFATLQLGASYLRPVREGRLTAAGRVVHRGRAAGHVEAEITDVEGRSVARFAATCAVLRAG